MTVKELREALAMFNDDAVVCFPDDFGDLLVAGGITYRKWDGREYAVIEYDLVRTNEHFHNEE